VFALLLGIPDKTVPLGTLGLIIRATLLTVASLTLLFTRNPSPATALILLVAKKADLVFTMLARLAVALGFGLIAQAFPTDAGLLLAELI
jgi:hypothetical protein